MVFAILLAAALPTMPVRQPKGIQPKCRLPEAIEVAGRGTAAERFGMRTLDRQPPALPLRAVVRTIDGCDRPMPVSERVGGR